MVGQRLAVLVDGSVVAAPVIMAKIAGGRAEITLAR
jgi:preprotein translocase subunit SecD